MLAISVNMVPISVIFGIMGVMNIPLDIMSITIASIAVLRLIIPYTTTIALERN